jgi:hypothetical protein
MTGRGPGAGPHGPNGPARGADHGPCGPRSAGGGRTRTRAADTTAPCPADTGFSPAGSSDDCPEGTPDHQTRRPTCRLRPGRSARSTAKCTCGRTPGLMTTSHSHPRLAGTGAGVGIRSARDEAAVLSVARHLTDRDRELFRLVARHRVLTTGQLAALAFRNITTARRRLTVLVRLSVLRRFRPHRATGSARDTTSSAPSARPCSARKTATTGNRCRWSAPTGNSPSNAPSGSGT